jgi:hypothetical protein
MSPLIASRRLRWTFFNGLSQERGLHPAVYHAHAVACSRLRDASPAEVVRSLQLRYEEEKRYMFTHLHVPLSYLLVYMI